MTRVLLLAVLRCVTLGALTAPVVVGLSVLLTDLVGNQRAPHILAIVISAGSAAAMIANPLFGWLADVTQGPLGRRRPWLVGGATFGFAGTAAMVWAPGPWWLLAAWVVTQAAYNACFGSLNGWVSEGLAPELRSRAAGVFSAAGFIGALPGLIVAGVFASNITVMLLVMPAVALVAVLVIGFRITDPKMSTSILHTRDWADGLRSVITRGFAGVWLVRFIFAVALSASLLFALFIFTERWEIERIEAIRLVAAATFVGTAGVVAASLALTLVKRRRWDDRQLLAGAYMVLGAALAVCGIAPDVRVFVAATFGAGVAIGVGYSCTRAIAHGLLPHDQSAFGLGVLNTATTAAPIVAPLIASALLALGGGLGLQDSYAGMLVLLGALTLPAVLLLRLVPRWSVLPSSRAAERESATAGD